MTIKIKNEYLEQTINNPTVQKILSKENFTTKTSYWLARAFAKLQSEAKPYSDTKKKLIDKYANHYKEEGEEKNKEGVVIKKWKKGDIISDNRGGIEFEDENEKLFVKENEELLKLEFDLDINLIKFNSDKEPSLTIKEMMLLLPLIKLEEPKEKNQEKE